MTTSDMKKAREWAENVRRIEVEYGRVHQDALAGARIIESLPDTVVDGDKLREALERCDKMTYPYEVIEHIEKTLLAPAPRTLADMNLEELKAHVGGEVMVDGWANPTMLVSVIEDEGAVLARRLNKPWPFVEVRPLSDLTPVAAPEQEAESTPETAQTRPEDVPPGEWWSVRYYGREWAGVRSDHEISDHGIEPWSIISMDGLDYRDVEDSEISLMFRLVPEIT